LGRFTALKQLLHFSTEPHPIPADSQQRQFIYTHYLNTTFVRGCLFMARNVAAKTSSRDPLKTVADALDAAVRAAKDGTADAKVAAAKMLPAAGRFLSRFVYTTSYTVSYGVVFPAVLLAKSIPANNAVVHGFVDGAQAANDMVIQMKHRRLEAPSQPVPSRTRTTKAKRKTTR
jgi:hypothetical protein